ncbi:MAG: glycosyltransferase [Pseudomonadales bacterium]|nr:glycosyltransferase [Pseudomonadales bacterium]
MIEILFWMALLLVVYSYLLYPLVLLQLSALYQLKRDVHYKLFSTGHGQERRTHQQAEGDLPPVTVVLSAYNEEKHISARLENLLTIEYPQDKLTIFIGCDGCSDNTVALTQAINDPRIKLFDFAENRGKTNVLNDLLGQVETPFTVFTDANTYFQQDALKKMVRHFDDTEVGAVCGELRFTPVEDGSNQDGLYWKLEKLLKFNESRLGALLGANGAIYCIRSNLYQTLAPDCIIDDFMVVMNISLNGFTVKYDSEAIAFEDEAPSAQDEYKRRVRIGPGNYQVFFRNLEALSIKKPMLAFCYVSHKVLRWFSPHLLLIALLANLMLLDALIYKISLSVQVLLYIGVFLVHRESWTPPGLLKLPVFLLYMNVALGHGFLRYLAGNAAGGWERTAR